MDRAIFDLQASVEATSLYILLCAIVDQGETPTLGRAGMQWNGTEEGLYQAAAELMRRGVLAPSPLTPKEPLTINPYFEWH